MKFHFDRAIISTGIRISITRCEAGDDEVQINICPKGDRSYPRFTLFLSNEGVAELGRALLEAVEETADAS